MEPFLVPYILKNTVAIQRYLLVKFRETDEGEFCDFLKNFPK